MIGYHREAYFNAIEATKVSRANVDRLRQELRDAEEQAYSHAVAEERALIAYAEIVGIPLGKLVVYDGSLLKHEEQKKSDELLASVPTAVSGESQ